MAPYKKTFKVVSLGKLKSISKKRDEDGRKLRALANFLFEDFKFSYSFSFPYSLGQYELLVCKDPHIARFGTDRATILEDDDVV
jgi:hypothetical protein